MKKRLLSLFLIGLLLTGCAFPGLSQPTSAGKKYTATFLDVFDTVTTIVGYDESKEAFEEKSRAIHDELRTFHQLFDIYNTYDGITNLKTVNDAAGGAPVQVDPAVMALLKDCKTYFDLTQGKVNVAMGSVLRLWHDAREDAFDDPAHAYLPESQALQEALAHTDLSFVVLDEAASTVQITDPKLRLDVGAVAKGWSVQKVAEKAPSGLLISVGGNVCATGAKDESGTPWVVGITDPNGGDYLHTIDNADKSVVTSGDYQRYFEVNGERYHHLIDPETLYPATHMRAVSIIHPDSGLADFLSTTAFLLPYEQSVELISSIPEAEALWTLNDGTEYSTEGFQKLVK